jgi:tRNA pseudouridine38-40 synthase
MKLAFGIEYDGSDFSGWQIQRDARTVQSVLETALSCVAARPIKVQCAGRTDAGVHASGQVMHIITEARRSTRSWVLGANSNLPGDVSVQWAQPVADDFHARFSPTSRTYQYVICNRMTRPGLWARKVTWEYRPLDHERMDDAASQLLGEHDFTSFRGKGCQAKNAVRTVRRINVRREGDLVILLVEANAFLLHMVRNVAGTLMAIGMGKAKPEWAAEVLALRDRSLAGITAPADGLYLTAVEYPARFELPPPQVNPLFSRCMPAAAEMG